MRPQRACAGVFPHERRTTADGCDKHRTTLDAGDLDGSLPAAMGDSSKHVNVLRWNLPRLRRSPVLRGVALCSL